MFAVWGSQTEIHKEDDFPWRLIERGNYLLTNICLSSAYLSRLGHVYILSVSAVQWENLLRYQCLNVKSIFVFIIMLHTISTLIHFVTFNYAVLLHILLGQTACIWAKAEKGPKGTTLFAFDALATLQRSSVVGFWLGEVLRQYNSVLLQKAKNTLILCLVLVICTSIVNMQDLRRRPGLEKNLAIVNDQQYYHCANCAFSVSSSCLWSQVVLPPPPKELPALGYK